MPNSERHLDASLWEPNRRYSPIDRLSLDALSLMFEICGQNDWKDAVRISEVSRVWRQCVLSTPRAWTFITLVSLRRRAYPDIRPYLPLSSPLPLHISTSGAVLEMTQLDGECHRLHCLRVDEFDDETVKRENWEFSTLQTLIVDGISPFIITEARFPRLQHFHCNDEIIPHADLQGQNIDSFPKLNTLSFCTDDDSIWIQILQHCRESLVSLRLYEGNSDESIVCDVTLPRLECLELNPEILSNWRISLKTPRLRTYVESTRWATTENSRAVHGDLETVENIRLVGGPYPHLPRDVRSLQISIRSNEDMEFVSHCLENNVYPRLHSIELEEDRSGDNPLKYGLSQFRLPNNPQVQVSIVTLFRVLPGMLAEVYDTVPCDNMRS